MDLDREEDPIESKSTEDNTSGEDETDFEWDYTESGAKCHGS